MHVPIAAILLLTCGTASAQSPDSTKTTGQWYVGAGAGYHFYYSINRPHVWVQPVYLMGGYTISPKVSVQAEVQYGRNIQTSYSQGEVDGKPYDFQYREETQGTAVTVLARFNRSRPDRHLQFDWLLGLALVNGVHKEASFRTSATTGEKTSYYYQPIREVTPHLVGGLSLRYLIGPHLAVGAEAMLSKNMKIFPYSVLGLAPGLGATAGVSYRFGRAGQ